MRAVSLWYRLLASLSRRYNSNVSDWEEHGAQGPYLLAREILFQDLDLRAITVLRLLERSLHLGEPNEEMEEYVRKRTEGTPPTLFACSSLNNLSCCLMNYEPSKNMSVRRTILPGLLENEPPWL